MRPEGTNSIRPWQYANQQQTMPAMGIKTNGKPQSMDPVKMGRFIEAANRESTLIDKFDEKRLKRLGIMECQTCSTRRYQDGSNDPGVSFKAPTHVSPEMSGSVVAAHEQEHVVRETAKAQSEGREVISQSVRLFSDVCPECGKAYVSGGVTETTTAKKPENNTAEEFIGNLVDIRL